MIDRAAAPPPPTSSPARASHARKVAAGLLAATLLTGLAGNAARAQDSSAAFFWVEESRRMQQRQRPTREPSDQRVRRLMPHKQFARPTILQARPAVVVPAVPPATPVALPPANQPESAAPAASATAPLPAATSPETVATVPTQPAEPPFTIAVIGDGFAVWLATGLTDAFPAGRGVTVISKGRDGTGLVREDFFDWPKALRDLLAGAKVDAVAVMIGANDRQPLRGPTGFAEPLSAAWETLYAKRIEALVGVAKDKKIPVLWVGMPIVKNERVALDIGAINEIERTRAEAAGARFIDVFDAFADEKGQYSAFGPDVNGQIVKLRTNDGVLFTPAGARKLAHFMEGDLRRLRDPAGGTTPTPVLPAAPALPPADVPVAAVPPPPDVPPAPTTLARAPDKETVAERPAVGPVIPLSLAPTSPGGELLGRSGAGAVTDAQRAAVETLLLRPRDPGAGTRTP